MYQRLEKIEKSFPWGISIVLAIVISVFSPPIGIILGWNKDVIIFLLLITNILFAIDMIMKTIIRKRKYIFSLEFVIDMTAIISGFLEILILLQIYTGPKVANLRILRSFKLIGRVGKIARFGRVIRLATFFQRFQALRAGRKERPDSRFILQISTKIQNVVMLLMAYIILRYGNPPSDYTSTESAWFDIEFMIQIVIMMIILGGVLQYYIKKLVGYPLVDLWLWLREKMKTYDFLSAVFVTLEKESQKKDSNELTLFKLGFEGFFDQIDYLSDDVKEFLAGKFSPSKKDKIILVSDIQGFSTMTADQEPDKIDAMMKKYFTILTDIVLKHHGKGMKYIGDSLISYWENSNQANEALLASMEISSYPDLLPTRIGLHFGPVTQTLVVEMKGRIQIDNFGDSISIATRLEDHNKETKTKILMSKEFFDCLSSDLKKSCKSFGFFKPKGAKQEIEVFSLK